MEALGVQAYARADAVRQASQLLRGTATEVVMELLQNARRAGATQIQITTTGGDAVAIDDDGSGMTNPERLLGFGESGWRRTPVGERPAGIGFFALAATGCIVRSTEQSATYRWWARLDPEHFRGEKAAPWHRARRNAGDGHGTKVTVPLHLHKEWVLEDLVRHFPVEVEINGRRAARTPFIDATKALEIQEWNGLRIAVYPATKEHNRSGLSYHGAIAPLPVLTMRNRPHVRVEVENEPAELELERPGLASVVENEFQQRLTEEAEAAIRRHARAA